MNYSGLPKFVKILTFKRQGKRQGKRIDFFRFKKRGVRFSFSLN